MGVVVQRTTKNYYHAHRVIMPDGSAFVFDAKKRADSNGARELPAKQALIAEPIETASNEKIPQPTEKSNTKAQKSDRDIDDAYVEYNRRALVSEETLEQWLRDYAADNPKLY